MDNMMKVKFLHPNAIVPTRAHDTDAGLDVFTIENGAIHAGKDGIVKTGIAISIPHGWSAIVKEKSGRSTNNKLTVGACVIDSGYRGEILIHLFNNGDIPFTYKAGEKIAQLVVVPVWTGYPEVVDELDETTRGEGRFGSTGLLSKEVIEDACAKKAMKEVIEEAQTKSEEMPEWKKRGFDNVSFYDAGDGKVGFDCKKPRLSRNLDTEEGREFWNMVDRVAKQTDDWPQWKKDEAIRWLDSNVRKNDDYQHNVTMRDITEEEKLLRDVLNMNGLGGKTIKEVIDEAHAGIPPHGDKQNLTKPKLNFTEVSEKDMLPECKYTGKYIKDCNCGHCKQSKLETRDDW